MSCKSNTRRWLRDKLVLEVGPGTDRSYVFDPKTTVGTREVVFVDIEPPAPHLAGKGHWVVASAEYLPFRDDSFEYIVASHVVEHLANPNKFLEESWRVLKRGGVLEIRCPNFLSRVAYRPDHLHVFNFLKLYMMLRGAGFKPVLYYTAGSLLPPVLRHVLHVVLNLLVDELRVRGLKP